MIKLSAKTRKIVLSILGAIIVLGTTQLTNIQIPQVLSGKTKEGFFKVVQVVDGDTLKAKINGKTETIRFIGINTPETVDPRKPIECFGKEASNKTKALLKGQDVKLEADETQQERDKYGRLLRYIYLEDGTFINLELVKQGYAYEYTYGTPYKFQEEFKRAQIEAELAEIGLWADGVCK